MAQKRDWKKIVLSYRADADKLRKSHPDAALVRCRKAMEAIQYSIFEEKNGEILDDSTFTYVNFETMMSRVKPGMIGDMISESHHIEFGTVHRWGNYGAHYQVDGEPTEEQVVLALGSLDNLIAWRFPKKLPVRGTGAKLEEPSPEHLIERSVELCARGDGWALLSAVGNTLRQLSPGFRINSTEYSKLIDLVNSYPDFFETKTVTHGTVYHYHIRNLNPIDN